MDLIGTIESDVGLATGKAEWIRVIEVHPQLQPAPFKKGSNPFSGKPHSYRPDPTTPNLRQWPFAYARQPEGGPGETPLALPPLWSGAP